MIMFHEEESLGSTLAGLVAMVAVIILRVLVLSILWGWFIVPLGAPALSVAQAVGIMLIVKLIAFRPTEKSEIEGRKWYRLTLAIATGIYTLLLLFLGWVIHLLM